MTDPLSYMPEPFPAGKLTAAQVCERLDVIKALCVAGQHARPVILELRYVANALEQAYPK